jgi:signal transduction histidine kinase
MVENCGIPIRDSELPDIFERGYRGDEAKLVTAEGTGLGLYITRRIMRLHGGDIIVTTSEKSNTTVLLTFPSRPK